MPLFPFQSRNKAANAYFSRKRSFEFCLPTKSITVPNGPDWLHEVKYDGYRLRLERDGDRVHLITRGGYNWASRYPWIVEAARKSGRSNSCSTAKRSCWALMASQTSTRFTRANMITKYNSALLIFSPMAATMSACSRYRCGRRAWSACWRGVLKVSSSIPSNAVSLGLICFERPATSGLEGLVSKRRDRPYEGGRCRYWIKVKNRKHPAMEREL